MADDPALYVYMYVYVVFFFWVRFVVEQAFWENNEYVALSSKDIR